MLTINPSEKELSHLLEKVTGKKVENVNQLSEGEKRKYHKLLREYTSEVMDIYAKQFDREVNGKKITGKDLVYVGKIEEQREYKNEDKQVKENKATLMKIWSTKDEGEKRALESKLHKTPSGDIIRAGLNKEGLQSHVHIVVSRYDKDKSTKMSPLSNSRGYSKEHQVGGRK